MSKTMSKSLMAVLVCGFLASNVAATTLSASQLLEHQAPAVDRIELTHQLVHLGLSPNEAAMRVARISDAELHTFAHQVKEGPAGAGKKETAWALVIAGVALFVYMNYK